MRKVKWRTAPVREGSVRSIQIGLRGGTENLLTEKNFVKKVTDVTERFT